jgi:integrase/recombinase XerD
VRRSVGANTPHSVAIQMDSLYGAARTMMPALDWTWQRDIKTRLYSVAPRRSSTRPVITSVQLMDLGVELMEESKIDGHKPFSLNDAVRYRDGLMVALLAHIPLRHKNFAALEIGRDVIKEDGKWSIVIPPRREHTLISKFLRISSIVSPMCGRGCFAGQDAKPFG